MADVNCGLIKVGSFLLRIAPGEHQEFPVEDNKELFPHFRKTSEEFKFRLDSFFGDDVQTFGLYKKVGDFAILVCAFSKPEDVNEEAKTIIESNPVLKKQFGGWVTNN